MDIKTIQQLNRSIGYITGVLQGMCLTSEHAPIAQDDVFLVLDGIERILDAEFEKALNMKFPLATPTVPEFSPPFYNVPCAGGPTL